MSERNAGYYWIDWTDRADPDLIEHRPAPLVGQWDGKGPGGFARMETYRFDCEVRVLRAVRGAGPAAAFDDRPRSP